MQVIILVINHLTRKGLCFALSSSRVPCLYANCNCGGSYGCTRVRIYTSHKPISALSPVAYDDMCFPMVRQPRRRRVVSLVSYRERENIGAISTRPNSRTVDLHTYRRFGGAAWLELRRNGVYTRYTRAILSDLSSATRCTLFRMSDLEIYGTPGSRA